jgi:N-acetylglutamate synthase
MTPPFTKAQVRAMEQAAARAWPAARTDSVSGWSVRLSGGGSRRANSVLPLDFQGHFDTSVVEVEQMYRAQNTRCYFQVSSSSEPGDLDDRLAARGYASEEPCLLLAKFMSATAMPNDVLVMETPSAEWLEIYTATLDTARSTTVASVLQSVPEPRAFLLYVRHGKPLSTALVAVAPGGIAIVECVATRTDGLRSGGAKSVMQALESWAAAQGADTVALQVVTNNQSARGLYTSLGYNEVGRYHYRWRDV